MVQIIKKIVNQQSIQGLNDSLKNLPCYGVCVQSTFDEKGNLIIKGEKAENLVLRLAPSLLALNIHLFNKKKLDINDYIYIAQMLAKISDKSPNTILSSSQLSRSTLNELRAIALEFRSDYSSKIVVASSDNLSNKDIRVGDMIYSGQLKSKLPSEYDRLTNYVNEGAFVLLDWQNNDGKCISNMIERTDSNDNLIVLSSKPKTIRRILSNR